MLQHARLLTRGSAHLFAVLGMGVILFASGCATYPDVRATGMGYARPGGNAPAPAPAPAPTYNAGWSNQVIRATGDGAPPPHAVSDAQRRLMARRAAVTDARRNLLEKIQGVYIDSQTTVRDFMTQSDEIRSAVQGIVRAAVEEVHDNPDGSATATVSTDLSGLGSVIQPPRNPPPRRAALPPMGGRARAMATRAATLDAQRKLVEKIYGSYVQSQSSVTNFQLDYDRILSQSQGILRWANEVGPPSYNPASGEAQVTLELKGRFVKDLVKQMKRMRRY